MSGEEANVVVPEDICEQANNLSSKLLPKRSATSYEKEYEHFCEWRKTRKVVGVTEDVLLCYFSEKGQKYSSNSLWSYYSKLKSVLRIRENVDLSK